jgi:hypothetical protein
MTLLVNIIRGKNIGIRTKFRRHCRRGSQEFLFIELVRTSLQTRLQTRLFGKIEFFERSDGLSSRPNNSTFDHHFAYRITPTRTYTLIQSVHKLITFNDNYSNNNILHQKKYKGFKVQPMNGYARTAKSH